MSTQTEASVRTIDLDTATPAHGKVEPPLRVTVDHDLGEGKPEAPRSRSLAEIFAAAQAKLDAAKGKPAAPAPEASTDATATEVDAAPAEPAPEDAPVDAAAEPADEAPVEDQPADPPAPPAPAFELEQARMELAETRRQLADLEQGRTRADFEGYFEKPVDALKSWVANTLGVKPDDPMVREELQSLYTELTADSLSGQDVPEQYKATLRDDRADRRIRLDSLSRQAAKRAQQSSAQEERARKTALAVYDSVKTQHPAVAPLAELAFRRPVDEVIVSFLQEGVRTGQITGWETKSDGELFTEAIRLANQSLTTWAKNIGSQLATLIPASAPAAPGPSTPQKLEKTTAPSQAPAPKPTNAPPRTLPAAKAGAAPSRPDVSGDQTPEPLPLSSKDRMAHIFAKYTK